MGVFYTPDYPKERKKQNEHHLVSPTNISVLSHTNIKIKIRHLMMVLSSIPDIEITCTDSSECFDNNKNYLTQRLAEEENECVRKIIRQDIDFLDQIQIEMATARQFVNQEIKIESYNSRKVITQEEAEIMCAKHLLWLYDQSGREQANFTNCDFTNAYMMHCNITDTKMIDNIMKNTNKENSYIENEEQEQIEESGLALSM